jgi:photosynthetic reaction center H subunit
MDATPLSGDLRPMTPAETGTTLSSDATMPHSLYDPSAAMDRVDSYPIRAVPADRYNGSAIIPTGDPMRDALGPAAYANRHDVPDRTVHGEAKIVPMSRAPGYHIDRRDPDPRGLPVKACDGVVAGTIIEVWVDRSEPQARYYQVRLAAGGRDVLLPTPFVQWPNFGLFGAMDHVKVKSITAAQFAHVPGLRRDDQITLLEEDRIMAYFAGGHLYARQQRAEPLL